MTTPDQPEKAVKAAIEVICIFTEYDHGCDCDECNALRTKTLPRVAKVIADAIERGEHRGE